MYAELNRVISEEKKNMENKNKAPATPGLSISALGLLLFFFSLTKVKTYGGNPCESLRAQYLLIKNSERESIK